MNGFPFVLMQGPGQRPCEHEVPARVRAALAFLDSLTEKTMTRAAVSESDIEEIYGLDLCKAEESARDAACTMLVDYFGGQLDLDPWERAGLIGKTGDGVRTNCVCTAVGDDGEPKGGCPLCGGSGKIIVFKGA